MNDEEPHAITDNEPAGEPTSTLVTIRRKKRKKIVVAVSFDDVLNEFELWNYIYDLRDTIEEEIEFETTPDYKNKLQYYEITAETRIINKLKFWLKTNNFKFTLDKV